MGEWWEERTIGEKVLVVLGFVVLGIGLLFLFGFVVMVLWNWLMPDIFGLPEVSYWQAWGLLLLSCILFKDFGSGSNDEKRSERKRKRKLQEYMETSESESDNENDTASDEDAPADRKDA